MDAVKTGDFKTGSLKNAVKNILAFKSLDADAVWINNTALDVVRFHFKAGPNASEDWFIEITADAPIVKDETQTLLGFAGDNQTLWLADGFLFLGNITGVFLDQRHPQLANLLLNRLPDALKELLPCKALCPQTPPKDAYGLTLRYGTHDLCFQTGIWMSKAQWLSWLSDKRFQRTPRQHHLAALRWDAPVNIGCLTLPLSECSRLEQGDLVFLEEIFFSNAGEGRIRLARLTADVTLEDLGDHYQLTIQRWNTNMNGNTNMNAEDYSYESDELIEEDTAMPMEDEDSDEQLPRATEAPITDVPLKLSVKLGSIHFTLDELNRMVEGKIYALDSVCPGKVQLMARGIEVARGQLVEVDGKLAVEIQRRWMQAQ
jgi:type III secretion system YscQ/HrcQ family protein